MRAGFDGEMCGVGDVLNCSNGVVASQVGAA